LYLYIYNFLLWIEMAHLTLKQLEIFIAVADCLSISKAARTLHLTQPAVSQQIHKIELYSGIVLFDQIGKKIYLSEDGRKLLQIAKNVTEQVELFKITYKNKNNNIQGKLKIGVGAPLQALIFKLINKFMHRFPSVNFEFLDGDRKTQLENINENKVDCCLIVHQENKIYLLNEKIIDLPMTFIISPQHHLNGKNNVTTEMLANETFIICEEGTANYHQLNELFNKLSNKPPKLMLIKDQNAVKHAVMANIGISILPSYMLQLEIKNNLLIPVIIDECAKPVTAAYWVQHVDKKNSPLIRTFKNFLFNELKEDNEKYSLSSNIASEIYLDEKLNA